MTEVVNHFHGTVTGDVHISHLDYILDLTFFILAGLNWDELHASLLDTRNLSNFGRSNKTLHNMEV